MEPEEKQKQFRKTEESFKYVMMKNLTELKENIYSMKQEQDAMKNEM